jgi:hypothetical protein
MSETIDVNDPSNFVRMGPKTLAEAREQIVQLVGEKNQLIDKLVKMGSLEAELAEAKSFGSTTATENENFRLLIVQKDGEIETLKGQITTFSGQISDLKSELETQQKSQKTARLHARELVAASGGSPIAVDQAEISRMQAGDEKEFRDNMLKTHDSAELNRPYNEYNKLFRPNGKQNKK